MSYKTPAIVIVFAVCTISPAAIFAQSSTNDPAVARSRYLPQYTASGELILPKNSMCREEGAILFKELQLTLKPEENSDGSRTESSGRGYFPVLSMAPVDCQGLEALCSHWWLGVLRFQSF
jgi:hypothetical protein